jgi:hypothetical protein
MGELMVRFEPYVGELADATPATSAAHHHIAGRISRCGHPARAVQVVAFEELTGNRARHFVRTSTPPTPSPISTLARWRGGRCSASAVTLARGPSRPSRRSTGASLNRKPNGAPRSLSVPASWPTSSSSSAATAASCARPPPRV